jgi:hypothetical protein
VSGWWKALVPDIVVPPLSMLDGPVDPGARRRDRSASSELNCTEQFA